MTVRTVLCAVAEPYGITNCISDAGTDRTSNTITIGVAHGVAHGGADPKPHTACRRVQPRRVRGGHILRYCTRVLQQRRPW